MPIYQGGKAKIGKQIANFIKMVEDIVEWKGEYMEPFCGLLGVGIHFASDGRQVLANDLNKDLILILKAIKQGWNPPRACSKKKYEKFRDSNTHSAVRGFYGFACAYSGIFYAGYRIKSGERNFFNTFRSSLINMRPALHNIKFTSKSYDKLQPKGMTIYCDPPYVDNNFGTEHFDSFDFDHFWQTMRKWSKDNLVFISEYRAPDDFTCVWRKNMKSGFNGDEKRKKRVEKLFMYLDN
jgi:DNA adenine methylase